MLTRLRIRRAQADNYPSRNITSRPQKSAVVDYGSAGLVVLAAGLAMCLAMVLAIGPLARNLADRQHAQSAADAAALGAVLNDCRAARELAGLNRAVLVSCERGPAPGGIGFVASVVVQIGAVSASARASNGQ